MFYKSLSPYRFCISFLGDKFLKACLAFSKINILIVIETTLNVQKEKCKSFVVFFLIRYLFIYFCFISDQSIHMGMGRPCHCPFSNNIWTFCNTLFGILYPLLCGWVSMFSVNFATHVISVVPNWNKWPKEVEVWVIVNVIFTDCFYQSFKVKLRHLIEVEMMIIIGTRNISSSKLT